MKAIIFDLDGTLADATHRLHHIKAKPPNWDAFFAECDSDPVIEPIRELAQSLSAQGYKIILVSGRSAKVREQTETWLFQYGVPYQDLHMRAEGDYRQDFIVKSEILDAILAEGNEIAFVVDDRPNVVAMWRERGLTCLHCRDWNEREGSAPGLLTLMVGPFGAGKTTWLTSAAAAEYGIHPWHVSMAARLYGSLSATSGAPSHERQPDAQMGQRLRHAIANLSRFAPTEPRPASQDP